MNVYTHRFTVRAMLSKVAEFHQNPKALKKLVPPPLIVRLNEVEPMSEGSRTDFTMWMGPLPIRWVALHTDVDPMQGFIDTQESGPFKSWTHHHRFRSIDQHTTEITDEIHAEPSSHVFWGIVSRLMWIGLPYLFNFRARVTRREIEKAA